MARFTTATNFREAAQAGLIGQAVSWLAMGFDVGTVEAMVQSAAEFLPAGDVLTIMEQATAQRTSGLEFAALQAGGKPSLSQIAVSPFMRPSTVRVEIVAEIQMPSIGKGTRAVLGCTFGYIPDAQDIEDCVNAAIESWMSTNYPGMRGFSFDWHIGLAERGSFFGK